MDGSSIHHRRLATKGKHELGGYLFIAMIPSRFWRWSVALRSNLGHDDWHIDTL